MLAVSLSWSILLREHHMIRLGRGTNKRDCVEWESGDSSSSEASSVSAGRCFYFSLYNLSKDIHSAYAFHQPMLRYLFGNWLAAFCISAFLGFVVGLLAWRRLTSEVWPGDKSDPESSTTTLGPLSGQ